MKQENKIEVCPGIFYTVPESTPDKPIELLYEDLSFDEQYWRRQTDFPNFFEAYDPHVPLREQCRINASRTEYKNDKLISLSVEDTIEMVRLIKREVDRMRNGIFIMNNGTRIYFPGVYYGALQWGKMFGVPLNDGYGEHRRYQREFACARQLAKENEYLDGYYLDKAKKTGFTQLVSLFVMIESITTKQYTAPMMSKSHDTAKKANFAYYLYALKNLVPVLRPPTEQKNWQNTVQKINLKTTDPVFSMENTIAAVPTTLSGIDGLPPTNDIIIDEPPKFPASVDIEKVYTKSKEQTRIQQTKIGIIEMFSYPPEEDTPAFYWCRQFFKDCQKIGPNGFPLNRMLPLFVGVVESSNGTFDKFGEPDKLRALQEEKAARDLCKTPYELQARLRQYPITAKESWQSGGAGTVYNNIALSEQETILEEQYHFGELNYMEGYLEWTGVRLKSPVRFVQLTHEQIMAGKRGPWKFYCTKEYLATHTNLCFKMPRKVKYINKERHELLQPPDYVFHCSGIDPVDYARVSEMGEKQSQNASVVKDLQGNLISVYLNRDEDPNTDIENFCMEIVFLGTYTILEGNRKTAITQVEDQGLWYFLLVLHPNGEIKPYNIGMTIKHVSSNKDIKSRYISLIMKKIANRIKQFLNPDIIKEHKEFDPAETHPFHLAVSDGLSEIAVEVMQAWVMSKKNITDKYADLAKIAKAVM